jgi:5-methyltetrahydrofolate--homocysteine methyltransferase
VRELNELYEELKEKVIDGNLNGAKEAARKLLDGGENPKAILDGALVPAMETVGDKFQNNEFFIPELLVAARAMEGCLQLLQPLLVASDAKPRGLAMIGTVKGDLHDIGKNIVGAMLKGAGFEVVDLGTDVDPAKFADEIAARKPDVVALSALLTTTMRMMKNTIEEVRKKGLRDKVKIMVGGAPLTQQYADEIGADGYGRDAADAVKLARSLVAV